MAEATFWASDDKLTPLAGATPSIDAPQVRCVDKVVVELKRSSSGDGVTLRTVPELLSVEDEEALKDMVLSERLTQIEIEGSGADRKRLDDYKRVSVEIVGKTQVAQSFVDIEMVKVIGEDGEERPKASEKMSKVDYLMPLAVFSLNLAIFAWGMEMAASSGKFELRVLYFLAAAMAVLSTLYLGEAEIIHPRDSHRVTLLGMLRKGKTDIDQKVSDAKHGIEECTKRALFLCWGALTLSFVGVLCGILGGWK